MTPEELEAMVAKLQNGELTEDEQVQLLKEMNMSTDAINKFLEETKIEQLKSELQ
jgi:Asp-tRNA(Asn)/Glu-tRNA(Gln) amidotransferase B subunit